MSDDIMSREELDRTLVYAGASPRNKRPIMAHDAALRAAVEDGVVLDRAFARRVLALLSGYRSHLNEHRRECPEGRNLPDAIDRLREHLQAAASTPTPDQP